MAPRQIAGLVLAFSAVAYAFADSLLASSRSPLQWLGDGLGLIAAVLWGATTLTIRASRLALASAEKVLFYQLAVSAGLLVAAALLAGESLPVQASWRLTGLLGFQAVIVSFASYLVWFWLMRHYPATQLSSFTLSSPIFGLLAASVLLGETITHRLVVAVLALGCGILLVNRPSTKSGTAARAGPPSDTAARG